MRLRFRNIVLRDFKAGDEEDMVRWMTVQTEWHDHDSPWLAERDFKAFDPEKYRGMAREYLKRPLRFGERSLLQIEDEMTGRHIGFVSAYYIDKQDEPLPAGEPAGMDCVYGLCMFYSDDSCSGNHSVYCVS